MRACDQQQVVICDGLHQTTRAEQSVSDVDVCNAIDSQLDLTYRLASDRTKIEEILIQLIKLKHKPVSSAIEMLWLDWTSDSIISFRVLLHLLPFGRNLKGSFEIRNFGGLGM